MSELDKLDNLIDVVEAGEDYVERHIQRAFGGYRSSANSAYINRAYHGSLDAALALHQALLPGCTLSVGQNAHYGDWNAWVRYAEDGEILDEYTAASDTAARSLLLAILRAYRSVQE